MEKEKILSSLEEIKVISDPFRLKILFLFGEDHTPLTVKQIAVKMEEVPAKVHYHVKELERIGVLEIVETKEKSGIIEKYYLTTAENFRVERRIGSTFGKADYIEAGAGFFEAIKQDFIQNEKRNDSMDKGTVRYGSYYLTEVEKNELMDMIMKYLEDKEQREGTKPYMFGYALFRKLDEKEKE